MILTTVQMTDLIRKAFPQAADASGNNVNPFWQHYLLGGLLIGSAVALLFVFTGLIGGMSWESTANYYRDINEQVKQRLGGLHSARILLYSVDFQEIERLQHQGHWDEAGEQLGDIARRLEGAGADVPEVGKDDEA